MQVAIPKAREVGEKGRKIADWCTGLLKKLEVGEIDFEKFDFTLAKGAVKFLDDFEPMPKPMKPIELIRFENLSISDISALGEREYNKQKTEMEKVKEAYQKESKKPAFENLSNYRHLKNMVLPILKKYNDPDYLKVQQVVSRLEGVI